jgi:hypothetical protein
MPWILPAVIIASAELIYSAYVIMMIVGHKIESEQSDSLEIIRKLINKTTSSELVERFRCLAEVLEASPIQCSCGFFILNLDCFVSVSKLFNCSNSIIKYGQSFFSFLQLSLIIFWWLLDLTNKVIDR